MSVSIVSCPSCQTLVLNDTAQCPNCQLILDPERMADIESTAAPAPRTEPRKRLEDPCPKCGEMVRRGLVRCWNCGEFMRGEIAQAYEQMQASQSPIIYSRIPAGEVSVQPAPAGRTADDESTSDLYAQDEDFELSPEFSLQQSQTQPAASKPANGVPPQTSADASAGPVEGADQEERSEGPEVPHSVATGGDVLLQVALQEEAESGKRTKGARRGPRALRGFLVYCPSGHRIEVQEHHRGRGGRCPRCKAPFYVPLREELPPETPAAGEAPAAAAGAPTTLVAGQYTRWLSDVHFHTVNPQKLKLKPGSLQNEFEECEFGFSPEGMLAVTLVKKGGLFGGGDKKKKAAAREAVHEHLREGKTRDKLPAAAHRFFSTEQMRQVGLAQPFPYAHESLFAGIPVFGDGRIAVKFPKIDDKPELHYASFPLSQFREFAGAMAEFYGVQELGAEFGVPLKDEFVEMACHYSDEKLQVLQNLEFYKADPSIKLKVIGRKCQACGVVVSEDSRKKEKIGGANGKGIAKAKCPKCKQKFGDISLFNFEAPEEKKDETPEARTTEAKATEAKPEEKKEPAGAAS